LTREMLNIYLDPNCSKEFDPGLIVEPHIINDGSVHVENKSLEFHRVIYTGLRSAIESLHSS